MDINYAIRKDEPIITVTSTLEENVLHEQWERSNHLIMFIKMSISVGIHGSVEHHSNVRALLKAIDMQFTTSDKTLASTLIMEMRDIIAQLKALEVHMFEFFFIHYILNTLPQ